MADASRLCITCRRREVTNSQRGVTSTLRICEPCRRTRSARRANVENFNVVVPASQQESIDSRTGRSWPAQSQLQMQQHQLQNQREQQEIIYQSTISPEMSYANLDYKTLAEVFLETYFPVEMVETWLHSALTLSDPQPHLTSALRALFLTKFGLLNDDGMAIVQARNVYGKALGQLNAALVKERNCVSDDTLAANRALFYREVLDTQKISLDHILKHEIGMNMMVQNRGPQSFQDTSLGKSIFRDFSYASIRISCYTVLTQVLNLECKLERSSATPREEVAASRAIDSLRIMNLSRAFLLEPEWQALASDYMSRLCSIACSVSRLGEQIAAFRDATDPAAYERKLDSLLIRVFQIDHELDVWHGEISEDLDVGGYWEDHKSLPDSISKTKLLYNFMLTPFKFTDITTALTYLGYWTLRLVIGNLTAALRKCQETMEAAEKAELEKQTGIHDPPIRGMNKFSIYTSQDSLDFLIKAYDEDARRKYAVNIFKSLRYCWQPEMGDYSYDRTFYSMRVAMVEMATFAAIPAQCMGVLGEECEGLGHERCALYRHERQRASGLNSAAAKKVYWLHSISVPSSKTNTPPTSKENTPDYNQYPSPSYPNFSPPPGQKSPTASSSSQSHQSSSAATASTQSPPPFVSSKSASPQPVFQHPAPPVQLPHALPPTWPAFPLQSPPPDPAASASQSMPPPQYPASSMSMQQQYQPGPSPPPNQPRNPNPGSGPQSIDMARMDLQQGGQPRAHSMSGPQEGSSTAPESSSVSANASGEQSKEQKKANLRAFAAAWNLQWANSEFVK